ncbi:Gfo/Idh/MocA family oxidoreductase [Microbacter sp. GSS18]|nr:Gfo/Idh/MocA family oxidoreductase [Microbacter sp. GSS18]
MQSDQGRLTGLGSAEPAGIGIIGCGNIADRYVTGMRRFDTLEIVGCADIFPAAAAALAERSGIRAYASPEELLADPAIDIVVNITTPNAHEQVTLEILRAGKHVYVEKPITVDPASAAGVLDAAAAAGLRVGAAPDTFLGSTSQTARAAIDEGLIGDVIGAVACIRYSRAEEWHPDPTFLFQEGGGPSLDLGPYYVSALVNLLGPVSEVSAFSRIGAPTRTVTASERRVDSVEVTVPTHASASLRFAGGAVVTLISSFDIWDTDIPFIELHGTKGALQMGDPNEYDTEVRVRLHSDDDWRTLPPAFPLTGEPGTPEQILRGIGVDDLVGALRGGPHRASGELALHVLEVLAAIDRSSAEHSVISIASSAERPAPVRDTTLAEELAF